MHSSPNGARNRERWDSCPGLSSARLVFPARTGRGRGAVRCRATATVAALANADAGRTVDVVARRTVEHRRTSDVVGAAVETNPLANRRSPAVDGAGGCRAGDVLASSLIGVA